MDAEFVQRVVQDAVSDWVDAGSYYFAAEGACKGDESLLPTVMDLGSQFLFANDLVILGDFAGPPDKEIANGFYTFGLNADESVAYLRTFVQEHPTYESVIGAEFWVTITLACYDFADELGLADSDWIASRKAREIKLQEESGWRTRGS